MNIVIVKAGGVGERMKSNIPKQFLMINGKPLLVHTLEQFNKSPLIDHIVVPTLSGWENTVKSYAKTYKLGKLDTVVIGGTSNLGSVYNAYSAASEKFQLGETDIVLMQDGNRPLITQEIINSLVTTAQEKGNSFAAIPCHSFAFVSGDGGKTTNSFFPRQELFFPQSDALSCKLFNEIISDIKKASGSAISVNDILINKGYTLNLIPGSEQNFKLTTPPELAILKAILP